MSIQELGPTASRFTSEANNSGGDLAVMLTGGGARAAYQVGLLKGIARHFPELRFQIITGVSAGAINATFLAAHPGTLGEQAEALADMWGELEGRHVYRFDWRTIIPFRSALSTMFRRPHWVRALPHGMVDTSPLRHLLCRVLTSTCAQPIDGIAENIQAGRLNALALITLDYSTGQSVRWVQGRRIEVYEGPNRRSTPTAITIEHVMASSALPFVFPAVRIGSEWHGDGGIRLAAPLSPSVHLGARRIIAMSTGYQRSPGEELPVVFGYPSASQVISQLVNAIFLDVIDEDVARMERMNEMIRKVEPRERNGFKPIDLLVLRPSRDLGKLAADYQQNLPRNLRLMMRALGSKETESLDVVSLLLFDPSYTKRLMELGEADVEMRLDEIAAFLAEEGPQAVAVN